jgi:hypothetical protein
MQAEAAMHLAEMVGQGLVTGEHYRAIEDLAAQLDLTAADAIQRVTEARTA